MKHTTLALGALLALTGPAFAQMSDNFDGYATSTVLDNVGGWFGWDNVPAAAGTVVSTFARSGVNSLQCTAGTDAIHPTLSINGGKWTFSAWQYIPTGGLSGGPVFFILNNNYNHGGPYNWTTELQANGTTVVDDLRTNTPQTIVFDTWVEYRVVIDIDANTVSNYYNGGLVSTGTWIWSGGPNALANVDLYSGGGTCYWDDLVLEQPFADNFDSYATSIALDNVNGWFGWDNVPAAAGTTDSTFAHSVPNSLLCDPGTDAVHPGLGVTSGKWSLKAWQYIPTGSLAGGAVYFIANNSYTHGGPYTWTTQLRFQGTNAYDDLRGGTPQPLVFDQWVEVRVDVDLGCNTCDSYYNNALISSGPWTGAWGGGGGPLAIENIDLYSAGGTCYWDDVSLRHPWSDSFDSYASTTVLQNVRGWFGWDAVPAAAGTIDTSVSRTAPNSLLCDPGTDAVHPKLGLTSGRWTLTAWQYIATGGLAGGEVYLILNNVYNHGGPYQWTTELKAAGTTVSDDFRAGTPQPIVFDQWAEYRVVFDLGANTVSNYYNGALVSTGVWNTLGGAVALENIDLFSNGGTCHWDDVALQCTPTALTKAYGTGCPGTGALVPAISATGLPTSGGSFSINLSSAAATSPAVLLFSPLCNDQLLGTCHLYVALPALSLAVVISDGAGNASVPLTVPAGVALGTNAYTQWVVIDPAGAYLGLAFSPGLRIQIGQ